MKKIKIAIFSLVKVFSNRTRWQVLHCSFSDQKDLDSSLISFYAGYELFQWNLDCITYYTKGTSSFYIDGNRRIIHAR